MESIMDEDIRWVQRFDNFKRALKQLDKAMDLMDERALTELEEQGVIQAFEYNHELAWKVLKDFFEHQGVQGMLGGRDAVTEAFNRGLIIEGDVWLDMIKKRNLTVHTYNEETTADILEAVVDTYYPEFVLLKNKLQTYLDDAR